MKQVKFTFTLLVIITGFHGCGMSENTAPDITGVIPVVKEIYIGSSRTFSCVVEDDGKSQLSYQWQSTGGSFQGETNGQSAEWIAPGEPGDCNISVSVDDGEFTDDYTFSIQVKDPNEIGDLTVGVYYYPWYGGGDFHGRNYLREHLVPVQTPELGEYNDREAQVIGQHLEWCKYAGISLWVSSWWGPGKLTDITLKDHIFQHPDLKDMKIALFYETSGRMPDFTDQSNVRSDIEYMAENYFSHTNYYTIDGRPVLFVYLTRVLSSKGVLESTVNIMRDAAGDSGFDLYIVGDQVFGSPPSSSSQMAFLDAVTNYDVYGSSGGKMYATQQKVDSYYEAQSGWRSKAHGAGAKFIPATSPGFNDTGVRDGHVPLSRKLTENDAFGSLFQAMVDKAITLVDKETGNLFMVTSWNEWHEDTQIEPVTEAPATAKDNSVSGEDYTAGMEYEGYGTRYLDILKALFSE